MTAAIASPAPPIAPLYLRSRGFDRFFVLGIPLCALLVGAYLLGNPRDLFTVLAFDLALLGYHHVISTYTRLAFDLQSAREHWALLLPLPVAIGLAVFFIAFHWGVALIATIYLYWQWYHYTRQSEGINKAYGFKTRSAQGGHAGFNRFVFYLVPVACLLLMSASPETNFLNMQVYKLPVPMWLAWGVFAVACACLVVWLIAQLRALREGSLGMLHFAYLCSHYVIYLVSYVAIHDLAVGWIVINAWHNMQYIAFVWLFNVNQFKGGIDPNRRLISFLSQERHFFIYLAVCLWLTRIIYNAIDSASGNFQAYSLVPLVVVVYQSVNFHHYIVDSQIWKLRSRKMQSTL
jgi:hypothetical protein